MVVLSLLNIGSTTALTAMFALTTSTLYVSYLIPIVLLVMKRLRKDHIAFGPWTLGRWGLPVNIFAILFGILVCIFVPFPTILPVTAQNMNYCGPVFGGLMILLPFYWRIKGRHTFKGPLQELLEPRNRRSSNSEAHLS